MRAADIPDPKAEDDAIRYACKVGYLRGRVTMPPVFPLDPIIRDLYSALDAKKVSG